MNLEDEIFKKGVEKCAQDRVKLIGYRIQRLQTIDMIDDLEDIETLIQELKELDLLHRDWKDKLGK